MIQGASCALRRPPPGALLMAATPLSSPRHQPRPPRAPRRGDCSVQAGASFLSVFALKKRLRVLTSSVLIVRRRHAGLTLCLCRQGWVPLGHHCVLLPVRLRGAGRASTRSGPLTETTEQAVRMGFSDCEAQG